jgi:hypothetical protein
MTSATFRSLGTSLTFAIHRRFSRLTQVRVFDHQHQMQWVGSNIVRAATAGDVRFAPPTAHAQSGIRDELTSRTLAVVDARRSSYKREVLRQAECWDLDDAV